jgi:hypothetical protein
MCDKIALYGRGRFSTQFEFLFDDDGEDDDEKTLSTRPMMMTFNGTPR